MKLLSIVAFLVTFSTVNAQESNKKEIKIIEIKTSAVCDMCKTTLEEGIIYEKGVQKSELNVKTKVFKIWYRTDKTDPASLREAVSELGYDADDVPAKPKAYKALDACCKKDFVH